MTDHRKAIQRTLRAAIEPELVVDGILGPKSRAAFEKLASATVIEQKPPSGASLGPVVDTRSEKAIMTLHEAIRPAARRVVAELQALGLDFRVTSALRTYDEQNALYEQGRTKPGKIVTNARAGHSLHNFGLAFDLTLFRNNQPVWSGTEYDQVGRVGKYHGFEWGGDWKGFVDRPHLQFVPKWAGDMSEKAMLAELRERKEDGRELLA